LNGSSIRRTLIPAAALLLVWTQTATAQQDAGSDRVLRQPPRMPAPEYADDAAAEVEVAVGAGITADQDAPAGPGSRSIPVLESIFVDDIVVDGNSVLDPASIESVLADYRGRQITFEELQAARLALSQVYVERGYVSSGVVIPEQEVVGGTVRLQAIEGELSRVALSGNKQLRDSFIEARIRNSLGNVLNITELQRSLSLLERREEIDQINAQLLPGRSLGESILDLRVRESRPIDLRVGYDNHRSPSVGEHQAWATLTHASLTGRGDNLSLGYSVADGLDDYSLSYAVPLSASDILLEAWYSDGDSVIVEEPFDQIDIKSRTKTLGARLTIPLSRSLTGAMTWSFVLENKRTASTLLGIPFSFAPGENFGRSEVTVLRTTLEWTRRSADDVIALRGTLSSGLPIFGATENQQGQYPVPESDFFTLMIQAQYARRLAWRRSQAVIRVTGQLADRPLLPVEKLAVGGARSVRGYRENQLVRDNGIVASAEIRVPVFLDDTGRSTYGLSVVPFIDYGKSWDESELLPTSNAEKLLSVGLGLSWQPLENVDMQAYYGVDLHDLNNNGDSLQEDGFHIAVSYGFEFPDFWR
jgi:hemolysin activation/secretion protein